MPLAPGTLVNNRYRVVSILGQGGMGAVYRASDEHLLIPVAIKENLFLTEEYGRQFQREAHILAGLRHPNLPHVSDYFALENQGQYLVMDYVEGEDLRQRMERMGALPEREAVLIGISICDALTYLHNRRAAIVHRDIKPGNIKVTADGQAVLVDFGLAKIMQGSQATSTGARAMTPGYSPPEQYGTARTDHRSDIYSLGATLYATLTGVIPEDGLARMTNKAKLTPIRDLTPKINRKLAESIECALEVDPEDRFQTAEDFKRALIESGELASYYQERPSISPPPDVNSNGEGAVLNEESAENNKPKSRESRARRRMKQKAVWVFAPLVLVVFAALFVLTAQRPDLIQIAQGYMSGTPVSNIYGTGVASVHTSQPTATLAQQPTSLTPQDQAQMSDPSPAAVETLAPEATQTPAATPTITQTPTGGGHGQIAFASDKIGVMEVWLLDVANPKNQRQITDRKDGACQPTFSPDGMRIAFISPCPGKQNTYRGSNIYMMNIDAAGNPDRGSLTQLTSSLEGDFDPAWAPDGKRIAFTSLRNGNPAIFVLNLDDLQVTELSHSSNPDKQPAWSPDGMNLAFVRQFLNSNQIWIMMDNGNLQKQYTFSGAVSNLWPTWSMDNQVIFYSQLSPDSQIPVLVYRRYENRNNQIESRTTTNTGPVAEAHQSPDGFWLAYESWPNDNNHDIYIMNTNGSNQIRLTTDPGFDFGPVWRPLIDAQP